MLLLLLTFAFPNPCLLTSVVCEYEKSTIITIGLNTHFEGNVCGGRANKNPFP